MNCNVHKTLLIEYRVLEREERGRGKECMRLCLYCLHCHRRQLVLPRLPCLVNNDEHFIGRQTYYPSRHWIRGQNRRTHLIKTLEECLVRCLIILQLVVVCHCQRGQIIYSLFMNLSSPFQSLKKILWVWWRKFHLVSASWKKLLLRKGLLIFRVVLRKRKDCHLNYQ